MTTAAELREALDEKDELVLFVEELTVALADSKALSQFESKPDGEKG